MKRFCFYCLQVAHQSNFRMKKCEMIQKSFVGQLIVLVLIVVSCIQFLSILYSQEGDWCWHVNSSINSWRLFPLNASRRSFLLRLRLFVDCNGSKMRWTPWIYTRSDSWLQRRISNKFLSCIDGFWNRGWTKTSASEINCAECHLKVAFWPSSWMRYIQRTDRRSLHLGQWVWSWFHPVFEWL